MRSKVIFVVLFMLTFTVMHDTFINIMPTDKHSSITHYVNTNLLSQECSDINEVHNMFHFLGVMTPYKSSSLQLKKEKTFSAYLFQYTFVQKETSYKPPIA